MSALLQEPLPKIFFISVSGFVDGLRRKISPKCDAVSLNRRE